ncbi:MAG: hypothetical protein Q9190_004272 [Brigantiaea leucoxantha]
MRQQRICEYLGLGCTHRPSTHRLSILSLPPDVRHQIYQKTSIITNSSIDLGRLPGDDSWFFTIAFDDTYALLQSNRTIYTEVLSYIFSTNRFFIHYRTRRSLQSLRNLSSTALAALRHLTIHVANASCEAGHPCCKTYPGRPKNCDHHDRALGVSCKRDQTILNEWMLTAAYIFKHIRSSVLHFHFVCDISTMDAAHCALAPLRATPPLASCAIRLAHEPDPILQRLARETALHAMARDRQANSLPSTSSTDVASPFRFLALCHELRRHILSFTDLVSPLCEIQYSPDRGYHLYYSTWCGGGSSTDDPESLHHACAFRNCWQRAKGNIGCFCSAVHSAFWAECRCWRPPTALFLVSKAVLEIAQEVFLSANRFIIVPEGDGSGRWLTTRAVVDHSPERTHAAIFLTQVIPWGALRHLRFLEVVFPPFRMPWMLAHEPAYLQWQEAIEIIRDHLTLPALTLRVYFADKFPINDSFRDTMTKEQAMEIYKSYMRVLMPLRGLKGLNKLFVHVAWPWEWTERGRRRRIEQRAAVERKVWDVEARLERMVMGETYQSEDLGKRGQERSQWMDDEQYG